jgi:hypothetical protein
MVHECSRMSRCRGFRFRELPGRACADGAWRDVVTGSGWSGATCRESLSLLVDRRSRSAWDGTEARGGAGGGARAAGGGGDLRCFRSSPSSAQSTSSARPDDRSRDSLWVPKLLDPKPHDESRETPGPPLGAARKRRAQGSATSEPWDHARHPLKRMSRAESHGSAKLARRAAFAFARHPAARRWASLAARTGIHERCVSKSR